ncbi:MAG: MFS transporter [Actinobacteria bacterium]|nr:MFS transporter [Actinomycetota bacterium]
MTLHSPQDAPEPRARIPREIQVLIAAAFVIAVGFGLITPVLPAFATSFDVGATAASIVVSAFAFFRLVGAPGGGRLVARFGERPIYLLGLVIVAISSAATAFAHNYWQLLAYRGLGGLGSTMFTISAVALLARLAPPAIRGRVSSAYGAAFLIGGVAGPAIGGLLGGLGLRVPFLAYAVCILLAAALVWAMLPKDAGRPVADGTARPAVTMRECLPDPAYRAALGSFFANGWANFGVRVAILPLFAAAVVSDQPWVAGLALAVFAVGNMLGLAWAGRRSDVRGRKPFVIGGLAVSGFATLWTGLAVTIPLLVGLCLIIGVGAGTMTPAQQAAAADIVGQERSGGPALAALQMAQDAGGILGPIAAGALVDLRGGYHWPFVVTGLVTLVAILPWLRARETSPAARAAYP